MFIKFILYCLVFLKSVLILSFYDIFCLLNFFIMKKRYQNKHYNNKNIQKYYKKYYILSYFIIYYIQYIE